MIQQIKHETGHVQFRMLRNSRIGQNSLQLSGSTPAHISGSKPLIQSHLASAALYKLCRAPDSDRDHAGQFEDKLKRQFFRTLKSRKYMEEKKLRDVQRALKMSSGV